MNVQPDLFNDRVITAVASYSGGVSSWAAAKRYAEEHGTEGLVLLFADALAEHPTTYRFLIQGAANIFGTADNFSHLAMELPPIDPVDSPRPGRRLIALDHLFGKVCAEIPGLIRIRDGRNPWQVFADEKMIGNSSIDPCSKILKRELIDAWKSFYAPDSWSIVGLDYTEHGRFARFSKRVTKALAPMMDEPFVDKSGMIEWAEAEGLIVGESYRLGFNHDNCWRRCCKAGQGHWAQVYKLDRPSFDDTEHTEAYLRGIVGDHSMLKDRTGGVVKSLPLSEFRVRLETGIGRVDRHDIGGCACAIDAPEEVAA